MGFIEHSETEGLPKMTEQEAIDSLVEQGDEPAVESETEVEQPKKGE